MSEEDLVRDPEIVMVWTTVGSLDAAKELAREVVETRVAACANVVDRLTSFYWWKGEIQEDVEFLVIFKTVPSRVEELAGEIRSRHPYEVPEIVVVETSRALRSYAEWVVASTGPAE